MKSDFKHDTKFLFRSLVLNVFLALCITISYLIYSDSQKPYEYNILWVLPIVYGFIVWCCYLSLGDNPPGIFFIIVSFIFSIRNVITPFLMYLGQYSGVFNLINRQDVNAAISMMIYESIILLLYTRFFLKHDQIKIVKKTDFNYITPIEKIIFACCILYFIISKVFFPSFYTIYTSVFNKESFRSFDESTVSSGGSYTVLSFIFPLVFSFMCIFILKISSLLKAEHHFSSLLITILTIVSPLFFLNNSDGFSLLQIAALVIVAYYLSATSGRIAISLVSFVFFVSFFYILHLISSNANVFYEKTYSMELSGAFQSYFPGVGNFAGYVNHNYGIGKFNTLFYDIYSTIPFRNTLFKIKGDDRLVMFYTSSNDALSQIIPCYCQLNYYLSYFAIIPECILYKFGSKTFSKIQIVNSPYLIYVYSLLLLYCIITPVMYNFTILFTRLFSTLLPMLILFSILEINIKENHLHSVR